MCCNETLGSCLVCCGNFPLEGYTHAQEWRAIYSAIQHLAWQVLGCKVLQPVLSKHCIRVYMYLIEPIFCIWNLVHLY